MMVLFRQIVILMKMLISKVIRNLEILQEMEGLTSNVDGM